MKICDCFGEGGLLACSEADDMLEIVERHCAWMIVVCGLR